MTKKISDYEKYIRTEELLNLQKKNDELCCDDELTFQTIHQIAELHFKLAIHHLHNAKKHIEKQAITEATMQLRRLNVHIQHAPQVFKIMELVEPIYYHTIRLSLGQGSGQDSPGFNDILKEGPTLWQPFDQLLQIEKITLIELHQQPTVHYPLFLLLQQLIEFDESFQILRYQHLQLVRRMIGLETVSLKGIPAQMLQKGIRHEFFPELWKVISELTDATGSSYNTKPL